MRSAVLAALLALAACDRGDPWAGEGEADDNLIECRIGDADQFERFCRVEEAQGQAGRTLTVHKPDGGFRRLLVTRDGRGVVAADGAEQAEVILIGDDRIEVAIGGDSFRLPARVRR
jgi:hypothetical protein